MTTEETPVAEETPDAESVEHLEDEGAKPGRLKRLTGRVKGLPRGKVLPALLVLLVVASAALAGGLLYFQYRPDRATDAAEAKSAMSAATEGTVAILSYSPDTLETDFSSAKSHLTGDFLSYYSQFTQQMVTPAAKQKSVKTSAVVVRAALSELHPDSAVVLVFVNQTTVSADRPEPTLASSSVLVTLTKVDEKWLISSFNPV
ncbi:twin-arginine translocation pathway signal [Mycobacterium sp.]|uniref:twin-arginine translocation pathway signal n=1 Tax=Mycobacterium sp. TaxID=1785 RepID=UPI003D6BF44D